MQRIQLSNVLTVACIGSILGTSALVGFILPERKSYEIRSAPGALAALQEELRRAERQGATAVFEAWLELPLAVYDAAPGAALTKTVAELEEGHRFSDLLLDMPVRGWSDEVVPLYERLLEDKPWPSHGFDQPRDLFTHAGLSFAWSELEGRWTLFSARLIQPLQLTEYRVRTHWEDFLEQKYGRSGSSCPSPCRFTTNFPTLVQGMQKARASRWPELFSSSSP